MSDFISGSAPPEVTAMPVDLREFPTKQLPKSLAGKSFEISIQKSRKDTYCSKMAVTAQDLVDMLSKPVIRPETHAQFMKMRREQQTDSKDAGGYVLGVLKNGKRNKHTVENLCGVALDADNANDTLFSMLKYSTSYLTIVHSTRKHTRDKPRYRIIIPLSRTVTPEEHSAVARKLAEHIGMDTFDKSTFEPNRMMFFPTISSDGDFVFEVLGDTLCDPDEVLAEYEDWHDTTQWPLCPEEKRIIAGTEKNAKDPRKKTGWIGAFNTAHTITEILEEYGTDVYEPSVIPNRWSYKQADSIAGLVIYNDLLVYSFHSSDPLSDGHSHDAFDLARYLKFRDLDKDLRADTKEQNLESYKAMLEFARHDPETILVFPDKKQEEVAATFGPVVSGAIDPDSVGDTAYTNEKQGGSNSGDGSPGNTPDLSDEEALEAAVKERAWKAKLQYDNYGKLLGNMFNLMLILLNDKNLRGIVYNELTDSLEIKGKVPWEHPNNTIWRDADDAQLLVYLALNYGDFSERIYRNGIAKVADDRSYHPIREYLDSLPVWDGVVRTEKLLVNCLGAEDTPYVRAVMRKTLIAAVARVMEPGIKFDNILVLTGPQGTGKSTLSKKLGMGWFNDSLALSDTKDKTAAEKLTGWWIMEIGELAGMRKADQEVLKGFLSRQNDIFRPAFGRRATPHPRQCIFIGTTNAEQGFLRDTTGNRRFWPVRVPGLSDEACETDTTELVKHSWELTQDDIDQIWAEAYFYYRAGEALTLPAELQEEAKASQKVSMETDDREPLVREYLEKLLPEGWYDLEVSRRINFLTIVEVLQVCENGWLRIRCKDSDTGFAYVSAADAHYTYGVGKKLYTVKHKDNLWKIAEEQLGTGLRYTDIRAVNGLTCNVIRVGMTLIMP